MWVSMTTRFQFLIVLIATLGAPVGQSLAAAPPTKAGGGAAIRTQTIAPKAVQPPGATSPKSSERASLGVALSDNTRGGVLILRVLPNSPAAAIGLQTGDRIMSVAGKPVSNYTEVAKIVSEYKPNTRIQLTVDRGGWTKTIGVTLGNVDTLSFPVAQSNRTRVLPPAPPAPAVAAPRIFVAPPINEDESPADIDDQHGYGG